MAGIANNPNSPRQKMINLMYLVFIAMMALNVSSEVLDGFELVGGQGAGKSSFFRLLAVKDEWFSDDLRRLDDDNVYRKLQGHWIIEMSEMIATANAKSIEEIKSFLSKQKETMDFISFFN